MQGRDAKKWVSGKYLTPLIAPPVGHQLPWVARYFDIGPVPMSGSSTAVKQTTARLGPSMRMNADLADWDRSLLNLTAGESGHVLSSHYKDQWDAYYNARSFPMQFGKVTGDFFGDFNTAILFQNDNGSVALWDLDGIKVGGGGLATASNPGPTWNIKSTGEFIGDGRHYAVVPPSQHPRGCEYEWLDGPPLGVGLLDLVHVSQDRPPRALGGAARSRSAGCLSFAAAPR